MPAWWGRTRRSRDLGIDSVTAVEVKAGINTATGLQLGSSLVFDYPTPQALADHLLEALGLAGGGAEAEVSVPALLPVAGDDVVIVGMGCRYPGGVRSPEDLWRLVAGGVDGMSGFPVDRGWRLLTLMRRLLRWVGLWIRRPSSMRGCLGFRRVRRWRWIRSSGCCWRCRGRRWNARGWIRGRCGVLRWVCSWVRRIRVMARVGCSRRPVMVMC